MSYSPPKAWYYLKRQRSRRTDDVPQVITDILARSTGGIWLVPEASKLFTTEAGVIGANAGDPVGRWESSAGSVADVRQATASSRPTAGDGYVQGDGTADYLVSTSGGGGATSFYLAARLRHSASATTQRIFGDRSGNNGRLFQVASTARAQLVGGNGSGLLTASPAATLTDGQEYIIEGWYDGANLRVAVDNGTVATAAVTLTGGSSSFGILANSDGTSPLAGKLYRFFWAQGVAPTSDERGLVRAALAS